MSTTRLQRKLPASLCLFICLACGGYSSTYADNVQLPPRAEWIPGEIYRDEKGEIKLDTSAEAIQRQGPSQNREITHRTSSRNIRLLWDASQTTLNRSELRGEIKYKVYLFTSSHQRERVHDAGSRREYHVQNLNPGSYRIRVTAYSTRTGVEGPFSDPILLIIE